MFSPAYVILFTIGLVATQSLLILVMAQSVRILLEYFLVLLHGQNDLGCDNQSSFYDFD